MKNINHIDKVIEYLQHLKKQNAVVEKMEINYGFRYATPLDDDYCEWMEKKIPDGSFRMEIFGASTK